MRRSAPGVSKGAALAHTTRRGQAVVELLRLGIVLLLTAAGFVLAPLAHDVIGVGDEATTQLVTSVLGALFGYLLGGGVGRAVVRGVDTASQRLQSVPAVTLVAGAAGAATGAFVGLVLLLPILLLPLQQVTVPVTLLVVLVLAYAGGRLGASRGADLGRFVGVRGRLEVSTPSRGGGVKVVDSSALIDGRLVEVARSGFLDGTLVVPMFVVEEVQGIADAGDPHRRRLGQRGLASLRVLQDEGLVGVEISTDPIPGVAEVDAKLAAMCRDRAAALITCDGNLARVAEISGVRALNLHALADAVRPPVLPGSRLELRLLKPGREDGQAVGYLEDGTMVVVDGAADAIGGLVEVDVTSIMNNRQGRMLFAVLAGAR